MAVEEWRKQLPKRNQEIIERVRKSQESPLAETCWSKTLGEVEKGWLTAPVPLTPLMAETIALTPRYIIEEQHGDRKTKTRLIDDFRASGVNNLISTVDTNIPGNLDVFLAVATFYKLISPSARLLATVVDYKNAYKNLPVCKQHDEFAAILIGPPTGELMVAYLRTLLFGSRRSPASWARITGFAQWVMLQLGSVFLAVYIDDCFTVEPAETAHSSLAVVRALNRALGLALAPEKCVYPAETLTLLGDNLTLAEAFVEATLPKRKAKDLMRSLRTTLQRGTLSPAAAAKLRGRLGWAQSLLFGRFGRAMLAPFTNRQYAKGSGRLPLSAELSEALPWRIAIISNPTPRRIKFTETQPIFVYVDACGAGHLGAVCFFLWSRTTVTTHTPQWFNKETGIFEKEQAATILGLLTANEIAPGRPLLLCCDNRGAVSTLVRGACASPLGRQFAAVFWSVAAKLGCAGWVERVTTELN